MDTQRNLLAALLAVQKDLVSLEEMRDLFPRWQTEATGEFLDWLVRQGKMTDEGLSLVDQLLQQKLRQHGGDVQAGLNSLAPAGDWQALTESQIATIGRATVGALPPAVAPIALPGRAAEPAIRDTPPPSGTDGTKRRYIRLRLHAAGGIGQVFLAHDTHLDRDVALKELKPEAAQDPSMGWRFLKEAHITGQLEHPGIVPVYELVTAESGEAPYYVMRFLRGKTLSQAIAEYHRQRTTEPATLQRASLLNVFSTVCQTVAFAHSRGIVHRDLKGANILLGDYGEVAVLDWGLAKKISTVEDTAVLRHERPCGMIDLDRSAEFERTLEGQVLGTPYYMSPEQATGKPVDARADVYSLGALLYEILTGRPPFARSPAAAKCEPSPSASEEAAKSSPAPGALPDAETREAATPEMSIRELLRRIANDEPPPPRQLQGDTPPALEAICLRALEKDPRDRYASAAELGQEVQRWLADEPVRAYPEPAWARLGRWARRHRALVASLGALLSATVIGLSIFTLLLSQEQKRTEDARARAEANLVLVGQEQKRTEDARARAEANLNKALRVVDYLTSTSEVRLLDEPGLQDLRSELLTGAVKFYDEFVSDQANHPAGRTALGEAQLKLADIHMKLGQRHEAIKTLEQTRDLFRELLAKDPDNDVYRFHLARCSHDIGTQIWRLKGSCQEADDLVEKARTELTELVRHKPLPAYRSFLAETHNSLAQLLVTRLREKPHDEDLRRRALAEQQAAVDIWQQLADEQPDNPDWPRSLSGALGNLTLIYDLRNDMKEREQALTRAARLLEELVHKQPRSLDYQMRLGGVYRNLGWHHRWLSVVARNETAAAAAQNDPVREALARKKAAAEAAAAEDLLRKAIQVRVKLARTSPQVPEYQNRAATDYFVLGQFFYDQALACKDRTRKEERQKLLAQAQETYARAIAMYQRLAEDYPDEKRYLASWGQCLNCMGDAVFEQSKPRAVPWYDQGIDKLESALKHLKKSAEYQTSLARAYEGRGDGRSLAKQIQPALADLDRAIELYTNSDDCQRAMQIRQRVFGQRVVELTRYDNDFIGAVAVIERALTEPIQPIEKFEWARHLAVCADMADEKKSPLADEYAARVVRLLQEARSGGAFTHAENVRNAEVLGQVVRVLRRRADYQDLMREVKKDGH